MPLALSVLDLSPIPAGSSGVQALRNTLDLARAAERLGYTRYWLAEHHNMPGVASTTPEIMIGQVARETTRLRVGSGGVMLPNHAPLKVAESFRMLEALYPGRVDLGIGRAPGTDRMTALALRRSREALGADDFPALLGELLAFAGGDFPADHPFRSVTAVPGDVPLPPIWLLGSSTYSAQFAGALSLGFAYAHHINPGGAVPALRTYREHFTPSAQLTRPATIVAASVICAETDARAEYLAASMDLMWVRLSSGRPGPLPTPEEALAYPYSAAERAVAREHRSHSLIGGPASVRAQIATLVEQTETAEVMVTTNLHSHAERLRSYDLLADLFDLPRAAQASGDAA
jgi:luciferase family oxidoreductase group 1